MDTGKPEVEGSVRSAAEDPAGGSAFARDTIPPTPEKAKVIEQALTGNAVVEQKFPSWPPPDGVQPEKIKEGIDYRIIEPSRMPGEIAPPSPVQPGLAQKPDAPATPVGRADPRAAWEYALVVREEALRKTEAQLIDKENRLLEREVVLGGRARLLDDREDKLKSREIRLRDWEARLMDREASLKEREVEFASRPPRATADTLLQSEILQPPPPPVEVVEPPTVMRSITGNFRIEITPGSGGWELLGETDSGKHGKR